MITFISAVLAIAGALNWFLVGVAKFDLIAYIFGSPEAVWARVIYVLVGVAGFWLVANLIRKRGKISKV